MQTYAIPEPTPPRNVAPSLFNALDIGICCNGQLPPIELLQDVLRSTSTWIVDGDHEEDNVPHTNKKFPRVDTFESLVALDRAIKPA